MALAIWNTALAKPHLYSDHGYVYTPAILAPGKRQKPSLIISSDNAAVRFSHVGDVKISTGFATLNTIVPAIQLYCVLDRSAAAISTYILEYLSVDDNGKPLEAEKLAEKYPSRNRIRVALAQFKNDFFRLDIQAAVAKECKENQYRYDLPVPHGRHKRTADLSKYKPPLEHFLRVQAAGSEVLKVAQLVYNNKDKIATVINQLGPFRDAISTVGTAAKLFSPIATTAASTIASVALGPAAIIGGSIVSIASLFGSRREISKLKAQISEQYNMIGTLAAAQHEMITSMRAWREDWAIAQMATLFEQAALDMRLLTTSLRDKKLDLNLLDADEFTAKMNSLRAAAKKEGLELLDLDPLAVSSLPLGYFVNDHNQLQIQTQLPLFDPTLNMGLHQLHSAPILTPNGPVEFDTDIEYIAVSSGNDASFYTLTRAEFADCKIIEGHFLCPHQRRILKQNTNLKGFDQERCVHALYLSQSQYIADNCRFRKATKTDAISAVNANTFAHYSEEPRNVKSKCSDPQDNMHTTVPAGHTLIEVMHGCRASTDSALFFVPTTYASATIFANNDREIPKALQQIAKLALQDHQRLVDLGLTISQVQNRSASHARAYATPEVNTNAGEISKEVAISTAVAAVPFLAKAIRAILIARRAVKSAKNRKRNNSASDNSSNSTAKSSHSSSNNRTDNSSNSSNTNSISLADIAPNTSTTANSNSNNDKAAAPVDPLAVAHERQRRRSSPPHDLADLTPLVKSLVAQQVQQILRDRPYSAAASTLRSVSPSFNPLPRHRN